MNRALIMVIGLNLCCVSPNSSLHAQDAKSCQLTVGTGPKGRIYSQLLRDIRTVCGAEVLLCELETQGGLQNTQELAGSKLELAFVQEDTLWGLKDSDERIASLRAVASINSNLLHILATQVGYVRPKSGLMGLLTGEDRSVVKKLSDLRGLPVVVVGSAQHLVPELDKSFGLGLKVEVADSEEQALARLRTGEVAAMLSMSGWPSRLIDTLPRDGTLRLVEFDLPVRAPYKLVNKNYPKLDAFKVPFLSVKNLLMARPFRSDGPYGAHVAALQHCLVGAIDTLKEGRFESGWAEVSDVLDTHGWPRFEAAVNPARR